MKRITDFINEASRNVKQRNIDMTKKMFINGRSYDNIMNFAILSAENPDSTKDTNQNNKKYMKELSDVLKRDHYTFVRQDGHYAGNVEHSYIVFNITPDVVSKLAGKFQQTSFFYCYPDGNGNIMNEYWEKSNTEQPYNSVKNPYVFINKTTKVHNEKDAEDFYSIIDNDYKYSIDCEVFDKVDTMLESCINDVMSAHNITESKDEFMNSVYNKVHMKYAYYKRDICNEIIL